tara:strand:- start:744 stop:1601 length:858 start_codon:yes stop_codon:yes gene_type:complete
MHSNLYVEEKMEDKYSMKYKVNKILFSGKSSFQTVDVVETELLGRMLLNDGLVMVTEKDEFVYHDMIAHVPMFTHPNPRKVLVIGGGDGGTAREVLRHESVESCVMVEIDEMVVNACKEFIPQTSCALNDPRLKLVIDDGLKYVKETNEKFDIILVDSTDPIGPAEPLFNINFYKDIYNCLTEEGLVISQGESPFYHKDMQQKLLAIKSSVFPISTIYNFSNLTYPGGLWSFSVGSKKYHPVRDFEPKRVQDSGISFKYYNEGIHTASFAIPSFMCQNLSSYIQG